MTSLVLQRRARRLIGRWAAFCAAGLLSLASAPALAQTSIDTITGWDGTNSIGSFGVTNTATYGQTITVPAGASPLNSFSFEIGHCGAPVTFRGLVYAWDGSKATGPSLYTSAPQTLLNSSAFQLVTFTSGALALPPGPYVLFASTSNDQAGAPSSACRWGSMRNNTAYAGGQFVFMNNGPDASRWITTAWSGISEDLAFRVVGLYAPPVAAVTAVPTLGEWGFLLLGLAAAGAGAHRLRRRA